MRSMDKEGAWGKKVTEVRERRDRTKNVEEKKHRRGE